MKDIFLVTPPFTQLNTPYPATAYLKGFLNTKNISSFQMDLGLEVILDLFTREGLQKMFDYSFLKNNILSDNSRRIYALRDAYLESIEEVIAFLQGKNHTFARQICMEQFLPQASRFEQIEDVEWAFGTMGFQDKAKHLATLYLEDLSDYIVECVDPNFGFSRYAERLGKSANQFDDLYAQLQTPTTYFDEIALGILEDRLVEIQPKIVGLSVPFPGNLYSAFRCAQFIRKNHPGIKIFMGGGFPTTELRSLSDPRVFEFVDYITLDDGELPVELLVNSLLDQESATGEDKTGPKKFKRTFYREDAEVIYNNLSSRSDYKQSELGTPDYSGLLLDKYISVIEIANPMHSLWSDGRWNKLTMAHGCYWGKCTFCDVTLDYIGSYVPNEAKILVDRMEQLIAQTGETGFHFVDEAAPPALMRALALEILKRKLRLTWWTNIRFEKSFTRDLCRLLKESGCIAVSGGLEVASDRLLALINKGVTVEQVARVTRNFTEEGVMVHAYLMYGYPSQTVQETVDSLEMVRQMFETGILQSGFWHQFALTAHSPIGHNTEAYGIVPDYKEISFANNDIEFYDKTGIEHDQFSFGLKKSLFNFMNGIGFDLPLQDWFDFKIPATKVPEDFILEAIEADEYFMTKPSAKIIWLGGEPTVLHHTKTKRGVTRHTLQMTFYDKVGSLEVSMDKDTGEWLLDVLKNLSFEEENLCTFAKLKSDFENHFDDFELFWYSKPLNALREHGLLVL
ncbi:MAG: radical SAM protein [Marinifilaceae bacterium]